MTFRTMTVKECFANPQCKAIIEELAPQIMKYPIKLLTRRAAVRSLTWWSARRSSPRMWPKPSKPRSTKSFEHAKSPISVKEVGLFLESQPRRGLLLAEMTSSRPSMKPLISA